MWGSDSMLAPSESLVSRSDEYPTYPLAYIIPILATLVIILDIPPLVWHYKNKNLAAFTMVLWMVLLIFTLFLNAILWPNDDTVHWFSGKGVCDVQVYFFVGSWTGIPCCLLCIMRSLARIMDTKNTVVNQNSRRRRNLIIDAVICFVPATIEMSVFYVVQRTRFFILGITGCTATVDNSWLGSLLIFVWPLAICLPVAVYAVLILVRLHRYRVEFARLLHASGMTKSRFLRLFIMAHLSLIVILPSQIYVLYYNVRLNIHDYSWEQVHQPNWSNPGKVPTGGRLRFDRWIWLLSGVANFLFFGLGADAFALYRKWLERLGLGKVCCCGGARRPSILPLNSASLSNAPPGSHSPARTGSTPSISARSLFGNKSYVMSTVNRSTISKPQHAKKRSLFTFWRSSTASDEDRSHLTSRGTIAETATTHSVCPSEVRRSTLTTFPPNYSLRKPSAAPSYGTDASTSSTVIGSPTFSDKEKRFSYGGGGILREIEIELGPVSPRMTAMVEEEQNQDQDQDQDREGEGERDQHSVIEEERDRINAEDTRRLEEFVIGHKDDGKTERPRKP